MAAAMPGSPGSPGRGGLDELLVCPICLDNFKNPKTLGCLHTFCSNCLENCRRPYRRDLTCPVCKKVTSLSPMGIHGLQDDFRIQQIKDILLIKSGNGASGDGGQSTSEAKHCDLCRSQQKQNSAQFHCIQCYMYFCSGCSQKHNANPVFQSHHVIGMSETNTSEALFCRSHKEHPVRYFCKPCGLMMCTICTLDHNPEHCPEPLERGIIEKYRTELTGSLETIKYKLTEVQSHAKYLETLKQSHQKALYGAQAAIKERTEEIISKIRDKEKKLLDDVQSLMEEKMKVHGIDNLGEIRFHKSSIEALYSEVQSVIQGSPQQCLMAYEEIVSRLKNVSDTQLPAVYKAKDKSFIKFVPASTDMEIIIGSLQECQLSEGDGGGDSLSSTPTSPVMRRSASSPINIQGATPKRGSKRVSSILGALSPSNKELKIGKVKSFASSPERSSSAINADDLIGPSSSDMEALPGPVLCPSSPTPSSPQPSSPTSTTMEDYRPLLATPRLLTQVDQVGGWPGKITSPSGIAILPDKNLVVAECENRIQVFDRSGNSVRIIGWGKIKPQSVTVTRNGQLAMTDKKDRCVKLFSTDGESVASWGMGTFGMPSGIAIQSNGNVIVTDVDRHSVNIHRSDGSPINQFGSWGAGDYQFHNPTYVAVNQFDNLLVSDSCNSCIKIFDPTGMFLRKFSLVSDKQGHIRRPQGIAVMRTGAILVADRDNHKVSMFSSDGQFLRHVLTKRDGLRYPGDICVDDQNQVAVVETHSGFLTKDPHHAVKLYQI